jgi:hypothetical protein
VSSFSSASWERDKAGVRLQSAQQQVQSVVAPCTGGLSVDNMLRVATVVQQIVTTVNAAESEEEKNSGYN